MTRTTPTTTRHSGTIDTRQIGRLVHEARGDVGTGIESLMTMMNEDAGEPAGERYGRDAGKPGYRWGTTTGMVGFQGGRTRVERPRVRGRETGRKLPLPDREEVRDGGFLEQWATSPMLMNGQAGKFRGAVRLPEAGVADDHGSGLPRSAVWRRIEAPAGERSGEWKSSDIPWPSPTE